MEIALANLHSITGFKKITVLHRLLVTRACWLKRQGQYHLVRSFLFVENPDFKMPSYSGGISVTLNGQLQTPSGHTELFSKK
jgi:hypothetical protein